MPFMFHNTGYWFYDDDLVPVANQYRPNSCPDCGTPEGSTHGEACPCLPSPAARRLAEMLVNGIRPSTVAHDYLPSAEDDDWRDLAMIARDGPIRPAAAPIPAAVEVTAKPALASLVRIAAMSHQLGSDFRF